ncbi:MULTISPECIES: Rossmann-like domain-containing protein [unclassified Streptomyces]|uniref:Rossmann-like domain-containing protein n=1 Tax=unclassified Streptomyces TaxID=2593676 RepID=UPI00352EFD61
MTATLPHAGPAPHAPAVPSVGALVRQVRSGAYGPDPAHERVSVAFTTSQAVRHHGRAGGYRNEVLSLRLAAAVGSCAVEPRSLPAAALDDCAGASVAELLDHPLLPVRIAALDAYLMHVRPHTPEHGARPHVVPRGDSLHRSRYRARAVVDLLPASGPRRVLVVGVVNSLLEQLRARGIGYVPCDLKGGATEWGEPVRTDARAELAHCDAILASGMTLGNGSFQPLLDHAARTGTPLVMFAQTGSAVLPRFLGAGVSAVSAEPYPFFWLDGGPGVIHRYGGSR